MRMAKNWHKAWSTWGLVALGILELARDNLPVHGRMQMNRPLYSSVSAGIRRQQCRGEIYPPTGSRRR